MDFSSSEDYLSGSDAESTFLLEFESSSEDDTATLLKDCLEANHYPDERWRLPKRKDFFDFVKKLDDARYRSVTRMTKEAFSRYATWSGTTRFPSLLNKPGELQAASSSVGTADGGFISL